MTRSTTTSFRSLRHRRTWCCTFYENVYRRSLFRPRLLWIAPREDTVRKDLAVHVSLSSDSLVKQPGPESPFGTGVPTPYGNAGEPSKPALRPRSGGRFTALNDEELRGRVISPKGGGAPCWGVYRRHLRPLSTALREILMTMQFALSHRDFWALSPGDRVSTLPCGRPMRRTAATLSGRCSSLGEAADEGHLRVSCFCHGLVAPPLGGNRFRTAGYQVFAWVFADKVLAH